MVNIDASEAIGVALGDAVSVVGGSLLRVASNAVAVNGINTVIGIAILNALTVVNGSRCLVGGNTVAVTSSTSDVFVTLGIYASLSDSNVVVWGYAALSIDGNTINVSSAPGGVYGISQSGAWSVNGSSLLSFDNNLRGSPGLKEQDPSSSPARCAGCAQAARKLAWRSGGSSGLKEQGPQLLPARCAGCAQRNLPRGLRNLSLREGCLIPCLDNSFDDSRRFQH